MERPRVGALAGSSTGCRPVAAKEQQTPKPELLCHWQTWPGHRGAGLDHPCLSS